MKSESAKITESLLISRIVSLVLYQLFKSKWLPILLKYRCNQFITLIKLWKGEKI